MVNQQVRTFDGKRGYILFQRGCMVTVRVGTRSFEYHASKVTAI